MRARAQSLQAASDQTRPELDRRPGRQPRLRRERSQSGRNLESPGFQVVATKHGVFARARTKPITASPSTRSRALGIPRGGGLRRERTQSPSPVLSCSWVRRGVESARTKPIADARGGGTKIPKKQFLRIRAVRAIRRIEAPFSIREVEQLQGADGRISRIASHGRRGGRGTVGLSAPMQP